MCGIAGFWDTSVTTSYDAMQNLVTHMRDALIHRGPDGGGNWVDVESGVAFGHRRLAILDLSEHGHQPMVSAHGRYVITYNGEIYNHLEVKQELLQQGLAPSWRGHSDTEIILAAFEAWGIEPALNKFVGMFAIAVWDRQEKQLYLIRDRMGEKPLYYGWLQNVLVFGSELKALKMHPNWQQSIDTSAVNLMLQYNCIPAPYTIYENIFKLEPGHFLVINADRSVTKHAYWQLKQAINRGTNYFIDADQAVDALDSLLKQTIQQQMLADVPVGAFLSGGIDSSTVVAIMQTQSVQPVKTFTIGFSEAEYNEAEQAKRIAKHLGTEHTELYLSSEKTRAIIPSMADFYDEPFADSSQLPTYMVAKLTKQHVTVSLSGDGGDELFAGYTRYTWANNIWRKIYMLPKPLRTAIAKFILYFAPNTWDKILGLLNPLLPDFAKQRHSGDKMHKLANLLRANSPQEIYQKLIVHWDMHNTQHLLPNLWSDLTDQSFTRSMMYIDSQRYLPDDILVKVDRAAMAVSLETRIPLLDHRIVEFAWSLPLEFKIRNKQNKWLLRQVLNRYVPQELYTRPKMGFGVPLDQWLRGPLKEWANDLLNNAMLNKHAMLNNNAIQQKWQEHLSGVCNWQYHLWDVLMFQSWYEKNHG